MNTRASARKALLIAVLTAAVLELPSAAALRIVAGKVTAVDARHHSFTLTPQSGKRRDPVQVKTAKKTEWTGLSRSGAPKVGDSVVVRGDAGKGGEVDAASVNVIDPNQKPVTAGSSGSKAH